MNARIAVLVTVGLVVLASCGGDDDAGADPATTTSTTTATTMATTMATTTTTTTTTATTTTVVAATTTTSISTTTTSPSTATTAAAPTTTAPTTTTIAVTTTTEPPRYEYPPVWPGPDDRLDTPEAAAAAFVSDVLGVPPVLGEFQQTDQRSGEIVVFSPTDDDDPATVFPRGLVELRRLAPSDAWFVTAASSEGVSITSPEPAATVSAGPLTVEGLGRGFESNLVVRALPTGDAGAEFDLQFTMTDWTTPVPYSVTLDLGGASPGDVVTVVAVGDTGLGVDPSEFAAISVVVGD